MNDSLEKTTLRILKEKVNNAKIVTSLETAINQATKTHQLKNEWRKSVQERRKFWDVALSELDQVKKSVFKEISDVLQSEMKKEIAKIEIVERKSVLIVNFDKSVESSIVDEKNKAATEKNRVAFRQRIVNIIDKKLGLKEGVNVLVGWQTVSAAANQGAFGAQIQVKKAFLSERLTGTNLYGPLLREIEYRNDDDDPRSGFYDELARFLNAVRAHLS